MHFATRAVRSHQPESRVTPISTPIYASSTYLLASADAAAQIASNPLDGGGYIYSRWSNPTVDAAAKCICSLEEGANTLVTASGMGAITTTLLTLLKAGDHVVSAGCVYGGTYELLANLLSRFGVEVTFVALDVAAYEAAIRPNTRVLYGETPANPTMSLLDLKAFAQLGQARGITTVVDGSLGSPFNQQPIKLGVDISIHSCTKYLAGHSDITAGCITVKDAAQYEPLWHTTKVVGATPSPFDAYLLVRGMKTLEVRMERHNANALAVATFLESHPKVVRVYYPGLASHPAHDICLSQMRGGGGMIAFELATMEQSRRLIESLHVINLAVSLGGVESLIEHAASMTHVIVPREERIAAGITDGLIRFSVGIEDARDLIADLKQGLDQIAV